MSNTGRNRILRHWRRAHTRCPSSYASSSRNSISASQASSSHWGASHNSARAASHRPNSSCRRQPRVPGRLVQVATAVSRKPATTGRANPKIISWACHQFGGIPAGQAWGCDTHSSQRVMASTPKPAAARNPALKASCHRGAMSRPLFIGHPMLQKSQPSPIGLPREACPS